MQPGPHESVQDRRVPTFVEYNFHDLRYSSTRRFRKCQGVKITAGPKYFVNGYFRDQVVTGQQRFAVEIANRLPEHLPDLVELQASAWAKRSRIRQWIELQANVPRRASDGLLISLTGRTPVRAMNQIVTIFDLFPITHPEWYSRQFSFIHSQLLRHHFKHAAGIIVISEPVRDAVSTLARTGMPITVAPCAPSTVLATPDAGVALESSYFLTVGSLEPRKNLRRLIAAYGLLHPRVRVETPLLIAGAQGVAGIFAHSAIADREIPKGVRFLGRVTDAELAALYRDATAFVSASLEEGFGLPVIEAAQTTNGVMVLSDIPTYRWVMGSTPAIYVDPLAIDSIADGLTAALTSAADIYSLRALAERFSWVSSSRAVADLAEEAACWS